MEPVEWIHCLATLDTTVLRRPGPKFCDEDGYDIVPIRIIKVVPNDQDEQPNHSVVETRKGGAPLPTSNNNILPPWHPKWLASLTSSAPTRGLPKDAPRSLSIQQIAQAHIKAQNLPPIDRLCVGCDVDHLIKDCPHYQARSQPKRPWEQVLDSPQAIEKKKTSVHIEITIMSETKTLSVLSTNLP